jgi:hypothetical protein
MQLCIVCVRVHVRRPLLCVYARKHAKDTRECESACVCVCVRERESSSSKHAAHLNQMVTFKSACICVCAWVLTESSHATHRHCMWPIKHAYISTYMIVCACEQVAQQPTCSKMVTFKSAYLNVCVCLHA